MSNIGRGLMSFAMMGIAVGVVITALEWPIRTALFPVIIGIPVFFMAMAMLFLSLFEKKGEGVAVKQPAVDFKLSEDIDQTLAIRRTLLSFAWIIGFFLLILLFSFSIAVPLFFLLYLKLQAREGWRISLLLTGSAWAFFFILFEWILNLRFSEGWLLKGLRMLGFG